MSTPAGYSDPDVPKGAGSDDGSRSTARVGVTDLTFALPDAEVFGERAIAEALALCASRMHLHSPESVVESLRNSDELALDYFEYGIACQVAEHLGAMDGEVRCVYVYDDEASPEDAGYSRHGFRIIHLIVRVGRRTGALNALIAAIDRPLVRAYAEMLDQQQMQHLLDVQVIDEADVQARKGYAALLFSIHHQPMRIWER